MSLLTTGHYDGCPDCYGSGQARWSDGDRPEYCSLCKGTGKELTDVGRELVRFLEEHYGLKIDTKLR